MITRAMLRRMNAVALPKRTTDPVPVVNDEQVEAIQQEVNVALPGPSTAPDVIPVVKSEHTLAIEAEVNAAFDVSSKSSTNSVANDPYVQEKRQLEQMLAKERAEKKAIEKDLDRERAIRMLERRERKRTFEELERKVFGPPAISKCIYCWYSLIGMRKSSIPFAEIPETFVDNRAMEEKYSLRDLAEYKARVKRRIENPTPQDVWNKYQYGDRWKEMINVPLPVVKIPHPIEVRRQQEEKKKKEVMDFAKEEMMRRRIAKVSRVCEECCDCTCVCPCYCAKRLSTSFNLNVDDPDPDTQASTSYQPFWN